jgi:hypothetical protein
MNPPPPTTNNLIPTPWNDGRFFDEPTESERKTFLNNFGFYPEKMIVDEDYRTCYCSPDYLSKNSLLDIVKESVSVSVHLIDKNPNTMDKKFCLQFFISFENGCKNEFFIEDVCEWSYDMWMEFCDREKGISLRRGGDFSLRVNEDDDNVIFDYFFSKITVPISSGILNKIKEKIEFAHANGLFNIDNNVQVKLNG